MRRDELEELHYITPIANLPSILTRGILSHHRTQHLRHESVGRPEIQAVRARVVVPAGRPLHEYVNLYFDARNPMLSVRRHQHARLCVARISTAVLDLDDVVIADQNAASAYVRWAAAPEGLAIVDRDLTFARSWKHPGDQILEWRHRLAKCAEVLVPSRVAPASVVGVYVSCPEARDRVRDLAHWLPATVNANLFFADGGSGLAAPANLDQGKAQASPASPKAAAAGTDGCSDEAAKIRRGWIALVEILARLEREPYRWPIGRVGFQQIAYFATELGIPTDFRYARGSHGPFSTEVRPSLTRLMRHGLVQAERRGRLVALRTGPAYPEATRADRAALQEWEPLIGRVVDLFLRLRTRQSEVAATVFFTTRRLTRPGAAPPFELEIFEAVKDWQPPRRPPLQDEGIGTAIRHLNMLGWVTARPSAALPLPASELLVSHDFEPGQIRRV